MAEASPRGAAHIGSWINSIKTVVLFAALGGLMVVVGDWVAPGGNGALMGLVIALAIVGITYWFSDKIAIAAARARPVSESDAPALYRIVRELTTQAELPMPKIYVAPARQPNAFATGRNPHHAAVVATTGILEILDEDELRAVLAHELSHVKNRDVLIGSIAAAIAMGITLLA
jgi:heat shock protein HtpX